MTNRRAARIDANQPALVKELRQAGYKVAITSGLGNGFPDLVVRHPTDQTALRLCEVKDPAKVPSARKLTKEEKEFAARWGDAVILIERFEDVTEALPISNIGEQP